jgi:WD40 repeat protein/tRNA A-37 threonylcarbamoyl transferase component Bud32
MTAAGPELANSTAADSIERAAATVRRFARKLWLDLARRDQSERWRAGAGERTERYFELLPELREDVEEALVLICGEARCRCENGERVTVAELANRFPDLADELAMQFELDSVFGNLSGVAEQAAPTAAAEVLPGFDLLKEIGRGASSIVYLARQRSVDRLVAVKVMPTWNIDEGRLNRHRQEGSILSRLLHPNIVQIYDTIETDGALCSIIEYVNGPTLAEFTAAQPQTPRLAAEWTVKLARALHAVHEAGILHRDLKPSNVLLASHGEPKITDFGLAKLLTSDNLLTTQHCLLGTPSYLPPERAAGDANAATQEGDIYSLGAILYELLTGRPPFLGVTILDTLSLIRDREPIPPHALQPGTPRDLETISLKCLAKLPAARYRTAAELARDLERYLSGESILARRPSPLERAARWCRRNRALSLALGLVAVLLVAVMAVSFSYSSRLRGELAKTQSAEQAGKLRLWDAYLAEIAARNSSRHIGQRFAALQTVDKAQALIPAIGATPNREIELRSAVMMSLALPDLRQLRRVAIVPTRMISSSLSLAADRYVISNEAGELVGFQLSSGGELFRLQHGVGRAMCAISSEGELAAVYGQEGTAVWRIDGKLAWKDEGAQILTFSPDGAEAAISAAQTGMRLVDASTGSTVRRLGRGEARRSQFDFHTATRRIAVCTTEGLQVISWDSGDVLAEIPLASEGECRVAWHPGGKFVAVWADDGIVMWNLETREKVASFFHRGYPMHMLFSADGARLMSYSLWDQRLLLWDVGTGQRLLEVLACAVSSCDFAADGALQFLRSQDQGLELWELALGAECQALAREQTPNLGPCIRASVSPDSRILALSLERGLELWDLATRDRVAVWSGGSCMAEFDRDGQLVLACERGIFRWPRRDELSPQDDTGSSRVLRVRFGPAERLTDELDPTTFSAGAVGSLVAFADKTGWKSMRLDGSHDTVTLPTIHDPRKAAVSSDGKHVAIAHWFAGGVTVWDGISGQPLVDLAVGRLGDVAFSPDGRLLVSTPDGVRLWRTHDWRLASELHATGTTPHGLGFAFSRDSRVLAVGQPDGVLRLVDTASGADWARISIVDLSCASVLAFTPDHTRMIALSLDEQSPGWIWNLAAMRRELARRGLDWPANTLPVTVESMSSALPMEVILDDPLFEIEPHTDQDPDATTGPQPSN